MKKFRNLLLTLLSVACLATVAVGFAGCQFGMQGSDSFNSSNVEEKESSKGLEFELTSDGKAYVVVGIGECQDAELVIPARYQALPVVSIGDAAFFRCDNLTSVVIPMGITSIGMNAFRDCSILSKIVIPDSVESIGYKAFSGCNNMVEMTLPFLGKSKNEEENAHLGVIFDGHRGVPITLRKVIITSATTIACEAFRGCSSLTSVVIPDSVTTIGNHAFAYCSSLTSVVIGDNVTTIGNYAFSDCDSLTNIEIPDSVTTIGDSAFFNCYDLTSVVIGDAVTTIGNYAFYYCSNLTSITFDGTVAQWNAIEKGYDWKYNVPATEVVCKDGVVSL